MSLGCFVALSAAAAPCPPVSGGAQDLDARLVALAAEGEVSFDLRERGLAYQARTDILSPRTPPTDTPSGHPLPPAQRAPLTSHAAWRQSATGGEAAR